MAKQFLNKSQTMAVCAFDLSTLEAVAGRSLELEAGLAH